MKPKQFKSWRKSQGLKQADLAELLGVKKRIIQYYEKGERDGKAIEIPRTVALAVWALENGVTDYDGSATTKKKKPKKRKAPQEL